MLAVFCLLLVLSLGHCQDNDLPSRTEIEGSINRTIVEVERQIHKDSTLPRLSRQEIVQILRNITSQDLNSFTDKEKIEKARKLYQRALMVVLPYNAGESYGNLKDLYTKPPITQMIPDLLNPGNGKTVAEEGRTGTEAIDSGADSSAPSASENLVPSSATYKTTVKDTQATTTKDRYKNHRETYSEVRTKVPLKETLKLDSTPLRFTFNLENLQKNSQTTEKAATARYPVYRSNGDKDLEIVYSTSVTEQPTTKPAPKEITINLEKPRNDQNVLTSSEWRYNPPPSTTFKPTVPSRLDKLPFLPTINAEPEDRLVASSTEGTEASTKDSMMAEALIMNSERPSALYVTPMPTETSSKGKYSSTYSLNSAGFRAAATTTTTSMPMRPEVMDLLASIGLRPDNKSNVEDVYKKNKDMLESKFQIPDTNSVIDATVSGLTSFASDAASIAKQNTFESTGSEIKKGMDNLSPDVQLLFQRFGLQSSKQDHSTTISTQRPTINLNSYTNFKPLPTSNVKDQEMKEFLARFGLGVTDNRRQKSMKLTTETPSLIEAVPGNMRGVLENMGLISSSRKTTKTVKNTVEDMDSTETSKFHVFKPHEVNVDDEKQRYKINELLDTVKLVQEGKVDIQSVRKVANDLLESAKTLKDGPDPLKLEEIIKIYNEDLKNEIKRQEEQRQETTTSGDVEETTLSSMATTESAGTSTDSAKAASGQLDSSSTTPAPDTSSTSTTVSNLLALEESFGGTSPPEPEPTVPPRPKSGLYFLVDWNSFLEVGDDGQEKINLRFQPKVGDRRRFLPVTVP
ncbi:uncharacterized protein LOC143376325 isoform X2 [Andrena cerasifolii]